MSLIKSSPNPLYPAPALIIEGEIVLNQEIFHQIEISHDGFPFPIIKTPLQHVLQGGKHKSVIVPSSYCIQFLRCYVRMAPSLIPKNGRFDIQALETAENDHTKRMKISQKQLKLDLRKVQEKDLVVSSTKSLVQVVRSANRVEKAYYSHELRRVASMERLACDATRCAFRSNGECLGIPKTVQNKLAMKETPAKEYSFNNINRVFLDLKTNDSVIETMLSSREQNFLGYTKPLTTTKDMEVDSPPPPNLGSSEEFSCDTSCNQPSAPGTYDGSYNLHELPKVEFVNAVVQSNVERAEAEAKALVLKSDYLIPFHKQTYDFDDLQGPRTSSWLFQIEALRRQLILHRHGTLQSNPSQPYCDKKSNCTMPKALENPPPEDEQHPIDLFLNVIRSLCG